MLRLIIFTSFLKNVAFWFNIIYSSAFESKNMYQSNPNFALTQPFQPFVDEIYVEMRYF